MNICRKKLKRSINQINKNLINKINQILKITLISVKFITLNTQKLSHHKIIKNKILTKT